MRTAGSPENCGFCGAMHEGCSSTKQLEPFAGPGQDANGPGGIGFGLTSTLAAPEDDGAVMAARMTSCGSIFTPPWATGFVK